MNKLYIVAMGIASSFIFLSFSTNPPDGNTGAPGDMLCVQCHIQANPSQNGTISLEGFPTSITPHQTYMLTVVNRLTSGEAVRAGFQVTILGPINTKAGEMTNPSSSSAVSVFGGRQYWDHSPAVEYPDSNVVRWTVQWTAPDLAPGSVITWYAAGNIADGNFSNLGDRIVAASGSGTIDLTATEELSLQKVKIYPNPGSEVIRIEVDENLSLTGEVACYNLTGQSLGIFEMQNRTVNLSSLLPGFYLLEIKEADRVHWARWSKL
jgi:hypothetical protein